MRVRCIVCVLLPLLLAESTRAQQNSTTASKVESVIDEWNAAFNMQNIHAFEKLYADEVILRNGRVSRSRVLALKEDLFNRRPWYRQRITTEVTYSRQPGGLVKCEFKRDVFDKGGWKQYSSYLLVGFKNGVCKIVGEGDVVERPGPGAANKTYGDVVSGKTDTAGERDSPVVPEIPVLPKMEHPDSIADDFASRDTVNTKTAFSYPVAAFPDISSLGMVTVPRAYVFALIAMLSIGGLLIFVADRIRSGKRRRVRRMTPHSEAEHVVPDFRVQATFETFVVTLFDPLYFKCMRPKAEPVYAGNEVVTERGPDLIFDYRQKSDHVRFAIICQYYRHIAKNEVQLLPYERRAFVRQYEIEKGFDVYYVLGFGGKPDDPRELFFIPASEVRSEYMARNELRQYSKSGMFYYNRRSERIQ